MAETNVQRLSKLNARETKLIKELLDVNIKRESIPSGYYNATKKDQARQMQLKKQANNIVNRLATVKRKKQELLGGS